MDYPSETNQYQVGHAALIRQSYRLLLQKELIPEAGSDVEFARLLFHAPFAVLSHDTAADPVFNYANKTALSLFELGWQELLRLPSRLSAEALKQADREKVLTAVKEKGYVDGYQGIRIARSGRRFMIKNTVVWNLLDSEHRYRGQAASISEWEFI
ncbi:MAG: MEKHLA domain-containing protein [Gammaproteobacteria bacterium]